MLGGPLAFMFGGILALNVYAIAGGVLALFFSYQIFGNTMAIDQLCKQLDFDAGGIRIPERRLNDLKKLFGDREVKYLSVRKSEEIERNRCL